MAEWSTAREGLFTQICPLLWGPGARQPAKSESFALFCKSDLHREQEQDLDMAVLQCAIVQKIGANIF